MGPLGPKKNRDDILRLAQVSRETRGPCQQSGILAAHGHRAFPSVEGTVT